MRSFAILTVLASLATSVISVSIPGLPACAGGCVLGFGSCTQLDVKCICSDSTLISGLACCVSAACSAADQNATISFADSLCAGQGVNDLPTSATCAPGQSPTPVGGSASGSATAAATSAASSGSAAASSVTASVSSAIAAASSSVVSAQSSASASVESAASSAAASNSAAASSATASSEANIQAVGGLSLGLLFAGMVAAL